MKCKVHSINKGTQSEMQGQEVLCLMGINHLLGSSLTCSSGGEFGEGRTGRKKDYKLFQLEMTMAHQLGTCLLGPFWGAMRAGAGFLGAMILGRL